MNTNRALSRRAALSAAVGLGAMALSRAAPADEPVEIVILHRAPGRVLPSVPIPQLPVTLDDGARTDLAGMMAGKVTALQFVLTGCSSICPILGTIFARVQDELGNQCGMPFQLVSFSLNPFGDSPQAFTKWLASYGAGAWWRGAIPQAEQEKIVSLLEGWGLSSGTSTAFHTETVLLIDRDAKLVYRSTDLPDPGQVTRLMRQLAAV